MTLATILADISSLSERDKEYILRFFTCHFTSSSSQQGALIGVFRKSKFSQGFHCRHCGSMSGVREMVANVISGKIVLKCAVI